MSETRTVPVLWSARAGAGDRSGVDHVGLWVSNRDRPGFNVDVTGNEASTASASWRLSAAAAAAVGITFSSVDPAGMGIHFSVSGPLDGSAGGAALTVGVLAALRNQALPADTALTGTIAPDGSIGSVADVTSKLRAAAAAGYQTVLVPTVNVMTAPGSVAATSGTGPSTTTPSPSTRTSQTKAPADKAPADKAPADKAPADKARPGNEPSDAAAPDLIKFGRSIGLHVRPVRDIGEAYQAFTGNTIGPSPAHAPALSRPVAAATTVMTRVLIARLATKLVATGAAPPSHRRPVQFMTDVTAARAALAAGQTARAYAIASDAYQRLARVNGARSAAKAIVATGMAGAQSKLRSDALAVARSADAVLVRAADTANMGLYQQLAVPTALTSISKAAAILRALAATLDPAGGAASTTHLLLVGSIIGEQRGQIEVLGPDALTVVAATPSIHGPGATATAALLSGYTPFLVSAGRANQEYFAATLKDSSMPSRVPGDAYAAVSGMGQKIAATSQGGKDPAADIVNAANAMTYYLAATGLVLTAPSPGASTAGTPSDAGAAGAQVAARLAIATGKATVDRYSAQLAARGVDAGLAVWSADWGTQAAAVVQGQPRETAGSLTALGQLWAAGQNALVLQAGAAQFGG